MVSILMPVKNAELFLHSTITSILNQTHQDWELIAVNDHSTDNSAPILAHYADADPRIKWFNNSGKGIIPALDLAFNRSKGIYITRMDADDIMVNQKLEWMLEVLSNQSNLSVCTGLVEYFSEHALMDGYKRYESWLNRLINERQFMANRFRECVIPSPAWMMSREGLLEIGGITNGLYPEDYELCLRMLDKKVKVCTVNKVIHRWRDHAHRASRNDPNYSDNLFAELKLDYFLKEAKRFESSIVLYGAGRKAKHLAKSLIAVNADFSWISSNPNKIGKDIYGKLIQSPTTLKGRFHVKIMVVVSSPQDQETIRKEMSDYTFQEGEHYYFFC